MGRRIWIVMLLCASFRLVSAGTVPELVATAPAADREAVPRPARLYLGPAREIQAAPRGPAALAAAVAGKRPAPRALASADFDEDGVPDVVAGSALGTSGVLSLHRGNVDAIYLSKLATREVDTCVRWATPETETGEFLTETPKPREFLWSLVTATGPYGQGLPMDSSDKPRLLSPSGECAVPCPHHTCVTGGELSPNWGTCEAQICQVDPYCCTTACDEICVGEVATVCNLAFGG